MSQTQTQSRATYQPERSLESLLPDIRNAVHAACFRHFGSQCDFEDFYHQVVLLLMEDDYRRLRSFAMRASIRTWLTAVAMHHVSNYARRQRRVIALEETDADGIVCHATQESLLISEDRQHRLRAAIGQLTARERGLFELLCRDDLASEEVARRMGIKVDSVRRRKHALIKKLRELLASPAGSKGGARAGQ